MEGAPTAAPPGPSGCSPSESEARARALRALVEAGVPFPVGGAYAYFKYTGLFRDTKDLDVFVRARDLDAALTAPERGGFRAERLDPSWLAKAWDGPWFVDVIFSSAKGLCPIDDACFDHARAARVMGTRCRWCR